MTVQPFLLDANDRALDEKKKAHCVGIAVTKTFIRDVIHIFIITILLALTVTGLGLGNWKLLEEQTQLLVDVYDLVLQEGSIYYYYININIILYLKCLELMKFCN